MAQRWLFPMLTESKRILAVFAGLIVPTFDAANSQASWVSSVFSSAEALHLVLLQGSKS
jgi:hypothetical protein